MKKLLIATLIAVALVPALVLAQTKVTVPFGGTGQGSFSLGAWLYGNDTGALQASSSPTVGWITTTSTNATSTFSGGLSSLLYNIFGGTLFSGAVTHNASTTFAVPPTSNIAAYDSNQLVRKNELDAVAAGQRFKEAARVGTTANGTLATAFENGDTIDGVVLATNDRILIKDQSTQAENGVYTVNASGAPTRGTDFDSTAEADAGATVTVNAGTANANTLWIQVTADPVIDTDPLVFNQLPAPDPITAGDAMLRTGNVLDVLFDDITIGLTSNMLQLKDLAVTGAKLAVGAIDLASNKITGILGVANGGTGASTLTANNVILGNGTSAVQFVAPSTSGNVLTSNGTTWTSAVATGGSGGANATSTFGATIMTYPVVAAAQTNQQWANQPAALTEIFGATNARIKADLTRAEAFRFNARQVTAGATNATLKAQCSTNGTDWTDMASSVGTMAIGALGTQPEVTPWDSVVSGCKSDVFVRLVGETGDAVADPTWRELNLQFRLTQPSVGQQATSTITVAVAATPNTAQGWTNQPAATTEIFGATNARFKYDTIGATQYRIVLNQAIAGAAGADINLQCSSDNTSFVAADSAGAGEVDITSIGLNVGTWADLSPSCEGADLYWRLVGKQGNAVADPSFRQIHVQFDTTEQVLGTNDWTFGTTYSELSLTPSTTIPVWFKDTVYASSTLFVNGTSTLATTTSAYTSKIGTATSYVEFISTDLNDPGDLGASVSDIPLIGFANTSELLGNNVGLMRGGIGLIDDDNAPTNMPQILFASNDISNIFTGASASMQYSTTTDHINVQDAKAFTVWDEPTGAMDGYPVLKVNAEDINVLIATSTPQSGYTLTVDGGGYYDGELFSHGLDTIPTNITELPGTIQLPERMRNIFFEDRYAYAVTYGTSTWDSIRVIDMVDPERPQIVGGETITGLPEADAKRILTAGDYAYVGYASTSDDVIRILDKSNPANMFVVGGQDLVFPFDDDNQGQPIYLSGHHLYVGGALSGGSALSVVDVSNPYDPEIVGTISGLPALMWDIKVVGDYAYAVFHPSDNDGGDTYRVINVKDKTNMTVTGGAGLALPNIQAWTINVENNLAYLGYGDFAETTTTEKFRIIDNSDKTDPVIVGGSGLALDGAGISYLKKMGKHVMAVTWQNKMHIIDVTSSTAPTLRLTEDITAGSNGINPVTFDFYGRYIGIGYAKIGLFGTSTDHFRMWEMNGGVDALSGNFGNLEVSYLKIANDAQFGNMVSIFGSLAVGSGGIMTDGAISANSTTTPSYIGLLGIASTTPWTNAVLGISGLTVTDNDVYITTSTRGIILTSPDGTCARGTINNSDVLSFASVTCP